MKKLIYIVFGVFVLALLTENVNFMYAEDDTLNSISINYSFNLNEGFSSDKISNNNLNLQLNDLNINTTTGSDNNTDNEINFYGEYQEQIIILNEINNQENINDNLEILPNLVDKQTFDISQVTQTIDTSSYDIIRIADPENPRKGITIHDRNLGATTTGAGKDAPDTSYGYYYQWGNNYGFPTTGIIDNILSYSDANVDASSYGPNSANGYYSSNTFITGSSDWSTVPNNNLWGGAGDNKNEGRGYPINNSTERQGPCPDGYHVPSIGEWSELLYFWKDSYTGSLQVRRDSSNNLRYFEGYTVALNDFYQKFNIPAAGNLSYEDSIPEDTTYQALLWSSSPLTTNNGIFRLFGRSSDLSTNNGTNNRANGFPVRCFYNSYRLPVKISYNINGGYWSGSENSNQIIITYTSNDGLVYNPNTELPAPKTNNNCGENKDKKCMFAGWYLGTGDESEMWTGDITKDTTLYAKWLPYEDKDISISMINFTIMDRNLGANNSGTGINSYGYYLTGGEENILCPEGYHIPSIGEWIGIKRFLDSDYSGDYIKNLLYLPFAGKITNIGTVENEGTGYYLAINGDDLMYAKINNSGIEIENLNGGEKVSVRCFKNYNTGIIVFNGNGADKIDDILTVNWREDGEDLIIPSRENSIFSGWYATSDFQQNSKLEKNINYKNEEEINLYAKWDCNEGYQKSGNKCEIIYYDITWIDGNGNILKTEKIKWGDTPVYNGTTPTKNSTSDYNYIFNGKWAPDIQIAKGNAIYTAQFNTEFINKSGGSSGGGGKKSTTDNNHGVTDSANELIGDDIANVVFIDSSIKTPEGQEGILSGSVGDEELTIIDSLDTISEGRSKEFVRAYKFAYKYGITTVDSIDQAKMYTSITRIEMAKMLSNYAINVLGKKPDISKGTVKFNDVTNKLNIEYDNAVTLSYQLGIMGQNIKNNKFRPYDNVTRAEFITALSRMLYNIQDGEGEVKYYEPYMIKAYNEGIINNMNPKIEEKRGYVMIMLLRSYYK